MGYPFRYLRVKGAARWLTWGAAGLGAVMAANLVAGSVAVSVRYVAKYTQTLGTDLAARGINPTNTISEAYTPFLTVGDTPIFSSLQVIGGRLALSNKVDHRSAMRYVALSSDEYDQYKADPKYVAEQRFYAILDKQFPLLATYQPAAVGQLTVLRSPASGTPWPTWWKSRTVG